MTAAPPMTDSLFDIGPEPAGDPHQPFRTGTVADTTRFGVILADPPWNYNTTSGPSDKLRGYSDGHYTPLTTTDLCDLPVGQLATDESVLLLWTTMPFIPDALSIVTAWGFDYVTALAWVKANPQTGAIGYGVGYWFRGAAELVVVGKRRKSYRSQYIGMSAPDENTHDESGLLITPGLRHSRKPDYIHDVAEATYPGPGLELFARRQRPGWTCLGNECPGDGRDIRASVAELAARAAR